MLSNGVVAPPVPGQPLSGPALLAFFKADCPACHLALRYLDSLSRSLGSGDHVVAVSQDELASTDKLMRSLGADLPLRFDRDLAASAGFGLEAVPTLFLLDRSGRVLASSQGFDKADLNRLGGELAKLLEVPDPELARTGDGNPDFQPGCVSRHLEPESDAAAAEIPDLYSRRAGRASRIDLPTEADAEEWCYESGYADPLPVVPPTVERVERMLAESGLHPAEVVAHVPPNFCAARADKLAANAGMAVRRPEYMRVPVPAGRFSFVIGENEEVSPWGPLAEDFGIDAGRNAVTFFCAEPPRPVSEHKAREPKVLLRAICPVLANLWSYRVCKRSEAVVVIGPEHAATLDRGGFAKRDVVEFLFENTGVPVSEYDGDGGEGTHEAGFYDECVIRGVRCYRKFRRPESIRVMVAGGPAGKFSAVLGSWATGPRGSQMVSYQFD